MTPEERFARIEQVTAVRETRRHIDEIAVNLGRIAAKAAERDAWLGARIEVMAEESRAADQLSREQRPAPG